MKLFWKTFLSFSAVIAFGSALTVFFVTNSILRTNRQEARVALTAEAQLTYDAFNAWKRAIWTSLVGLAADPALRAAVDAGDRTSVSAELRDLFIRSAYDVVFFARDDGRYSDVLPGGYNTFSLADLEGLTVEREPPYVEVRPVGQSLTITGVTRIDGLEVFIVKRIDAAFCNALRLNRRAVCAFYDRGRYIVGSTLPSRRTPEFPAELPEELPVPPGPASSYTERYARPPGAGLWNIGEQRIPNVTSSFAAAGDQSTGADPASATVLVLATYVSNVPYEQRIFAIRRIVLLVTAGSAIVSLLISLGLSNNITVPIRRLLHAMERFRAGELVHAAAARSGDEIAQLLTRFNAMASELHEDRVAMDRYVGEITFLNEYNERIIESIHAGILVVDENGSASTANAAFRRMFGLGDRKIAGVAAGALGVEVIDAGLLGEVARIRNGSSVSAQRLQRTKAGRVIELRLSRVAMAASAGFGCIVAADDVTEKVDLEEKIFHAEKLASLSMLSAGVAHEINNPLSSILTNAQNLLMDERPPADRAALKWIEQETRRIAGIVREMLRFASPDFDSDEGADVSSVAAEAIQLMEYSLYRTRGVAIERHFAEGLPRGNISPNDLKQVLVNLFTNSAQAMPSGGTISVSTCRLPDGTIGLTVSDTGVGIAREVIPHIFDPFFTTKPNGEGTGLGLSVVYGLLQRCRAGIEVTSEPGKGTRMEITLRNSTPAPGASAGRDGSHE